VYSTQKTFLTEEWKNNVLFVAVKEAELKRDVTTAFYHLLYLQQKAQLLQEADSLYSAFYRLTELRLQKGESNVLEKATAETQLGQIRLQRQQLQKDQALIQLQFQLLLNSTTTFTVSTKELKHTVLLAPAELSNHPNIAFIKQQQQIADAAIAVEKAKLLPDLSLGLFSTSIRGTGADNNFYPSSYRFQSMQVGIGIPVFAKAQKAKINSAKFSKQLAANQYALSINVLNTHYQSAQQQYLKYKESVDYFEKTGLQNATLILTTANKQFNSGLINYLEWFMLINQATGIKNDYLEAVKNLNESSIQLNYYSNQ
jgi:cobalt-zinc-cadmium resistance protein CzcA